MTPREIAEKIVDEYLTSFMLTAVIEEELIKTIKKCAEIARERVLTPTNEIYVQKYRDDQMEFIADEILKLLGESDGK